ILADDFDQSAACLGVSLDAAIGELLCDPLGESPLRDVVDEDLAGLAAGLRKSRILLQLLTNEREHGVGRRRGEVFGDRLDVGGFPALHVRDDDEALAGTKQAGRVTCCDRVGTSSVEGREELGRFVAYAVAQSADRALNLRTVTAEDQVDGLELGRHRGQAEAAARNPPASTRSSARVDWICAPGRLPATRAQVAMYAASQPLSQASIDAAAGATGAMAADANASASSGSIAGAARAFA